MSAPGSGRIRLPVRLRALGAKLQMALDALTLVLIAVTVLVLILAWRGREGRQTASPDSAARQTLASWTNLATGGHLMGSPRAPVKIVEFSDFTCIHCTEQHLTLQRLRQLFPDHVAVIYRHFPRTQGYVFALAAECLTAQRSFEAFHDAAFRLSPADHPDVTWERVARAARVKDINRIAECVKTGASQERVEADVTEARRLGLRGTPILVINGVMFGGLQSYEAMRNEVIRELNTLNPSRKAYADRHGR